MEVAKAASAMVRQLKLNTGAYMPMMSIGFLQRLNNSWQDPSKTPFEKAVDLGFRHFENVIFDDKQTTNLSIADYVEKGLCKREDLFIAAKMECRDMFPDKLQAPFAKTLSDLKTDYLDLYLLPWPHRVHQKKNFDDFSHIEKYHEDWMIELWSELEKMVDNGTVKAIGVSNFTIKQIDNLIANCKIPPAVNQVENNLYFQQHLMKRYLDSKNIVMQAFGSVGVHNTTNSLHKDDRLFDNLTLQRIAMKHGVSVSQICLAFLMAEDRVVLTKCNHLARMEDNIKSVQIKLTDEDIQNLRRQDRNRRNFHPRFLIPHSLHVNFWDIDYDLEYEQKLRLEAKN